MKPSVVWASAIMLAFLIVLLVGFRNLSQPPTSYVVNPSKCRVFPPATGK